jgi:geranylgeranyl diphosphate synthase type I
VPGAINVSQVLLSLAQQAILSLRDKKVEASLILALSQSITHSLLRATAGQHQDLVAEEQSVQAFDVSMCLEIAAQKSGTLLQLACLLGAQAAGADTQTCDRWAHLGEVLGIAMQLDNDCHDLAHSLPELQNALLPDSTESGRLQTTDLVRHKKTLPVVLAAQHLTLVDQITGEGEEQLLALHMGIIQAYALSKRYFQEAQLLALELRQEHFLTAHLQYVLGLSMHDDG